MTIRTMSSLKVLLDFGKEPRAVGDLVWRDRRIYFAYAPEFLSSGLHISPFRLPLKAETQTGTPDVFNGLPGVFDDSLPDGWGRLLMDRKLAGEGINPGTLTPLDRLAYVGNRGMGALVYEPDHSGNASQAAELDLDLLAMDAQKILDGGSGEVLNELVALNGSSAGARPKAMIGVNPDFTRIVHGTDTLPETMSHWLVKFPSSQDQANAGAKEYAYAGAARAAGIDMMPVHLFPSKKGDGYFATQRFDRIGDKRLHVHSACGLLHSNFRMPSLDYNDLMVLTSSLTRDHREVEKMFRLAAFNVLAHNRDDHGKNFSFVMDKDGQWALAPAYDLTWSEGPGGEQSTTVLGKGKNIIKVDLQQLARNHGIKRVRAQEILAQVAAAANDLFASLKMNRSD